MKARIAFVIAIGLLLACALMVYGTLRGLSESEAKVEHTQRVQVLVGETEAAIASAARARLTYIFGGDQDALAQYQAAVSRIPEKLAELRQNTRDNPRQQANCDRLEQLVRTRVELWQKSVAFKQSGAPELPGQPDFTRQSVAFAEEIISVTQAMRDEESQLLAGRKVAAGFNFMLTNALLVASFVAAVWLLFWHYRLQKEELIAREAAEKSTLEAAAAAQISESRAREAEKLARSSHDATRHLSARLLHLQDEERRRLSRELHDSTGQHLAAAKMVLSSLAAAQAGDRRLSECVDLVDKSLQEIRTISHLLHPSGLEEAGFSNAARWYVEEFAKRSGISVQVNIADLPVRMSRELEIALFRVLQEGLTNVHRHSRSTSAAVRFEALGSDVVLEIKDQGIGLSPELLQQLRLAGGYGVGLGGIRERVREFDGTFEIDSDESGTCLRVTVPRPAFAQAEALPPAPLKKSSGFTA